MNAPLLARKADCFHKGQHWAAAGAAYESGLRLIASALVLTLLIATFMPPLVWNANEEYYFMLSYRRFAPDLFTENSVVFHETTNSRFIGEYFMGGLISYFGYEISHTILRCLMAVAYGISLAYLFRALGLALSEGVIILCIYILLWQQTIGGEWLFWGVETKTMAYAAVFASLALVIQAKWRLAVLFAVLATYLHFLVGGFWSFVLLLVYFHLHRKPSNTVYFAMVYGGAVLPLIAILAFEQFSTAPLQSNDGVSGTYIFFLRGARHVAPFINESQFWGRWAPEILATLVAALVSVGWLRFVRDPLTRTLLLTVTGVCAYLFIALLASYFDRNTGTLGKFFLFRPAGLGLLLFIIAMMLSLKEELKKSLPKVSAVVLVPLAILLFGNSLLNAVSETQAAISDQQMTKQSLTRVLNFLKSSTGIDSVILIDPKFDSEKYTNLRKLINRPTLVGRKYMPTNPAAIIRWQNLMNFREDIFRNGCVGPIKHRVDFILVNVSDKSRGEKEHLFRSCGDVVVSTDQYLVVRVKEQLRSPPT